MTRNKSIKIDQSKRSLNELIRLYERNYQKLIKLIYKISNLKEFQKFKKIQPKNIKDIYNLRDYVHLKLYALGI